MHCIVVQLCVIPCTVRLLVAALHEAMQVTRTQVHYKFRDGWLFSQAQRFRALLRGVCAPQLCKLYPQTSVFATLHRVPAVVVAAVVA